MHTVYEDARSRGLSHDGLMKPEGEIYANEEECFLDIRQSDSCQENLPGALFHPALMDGAAMASGVLQTAAGAGLFYRFIMIRLLPLRPLRSAVTR